MILQQDGAPSYFSKEARTWLNEKFNGRWIGRGDPISWAAHPPDLTPLDFVLCGYMKTKINHIADLKERIEQEINAIRDIEECFSMVL